MEMGEQQEARYTCRRCRTELFTEGHLERHATGAQAIVRRKKVRVQGVDSIDKIDDRGPRWSIH